MTKRLLLTGIALAQPHNVRDFQEIYEKKKKISRQNI
jgi:hypothetical protein